MVGRCCHFGISSSGKWYVHIIFLFFIRFYSDDPLVSPVARPLVVRATICRSRSFATRYQAGRSVVDNFCVFFRRKVLQVLVNATIRRTLCVVVVDVLRITFKSPSAPSVGTHARNSVIVSTSHLTSTLTYHHPPSVLAYVYIHCFIFICR